MTLTSTVAHFSIPLPDIRAGPGVVFFAVDYKPITYRRFTTIPSTMSHNPTRFFALDPTTKGFGYAVFELPFRLIEWDLARVPDDKHKGAIVQFEKLLTRFRPDAVVLEDAEAPGSRRRPRVRLLIKALVTRAREQDIAVHVVPRSAVLKCFSSPDSPATKHSIAERLTTHFPELAPKLPPPRKPWQSEDERMSVFDALALAVTYANK